MPRSLISRVEMKNTINTMNNGLSNVMSFYQELHVALST
jgi:hypothetical protein